MGTGKYPKDSTFVDSCRCMALSIKQHFLKTDTYCLDLLRLTINKVPRKDVLPPFLVLSWVLWQWMSRECSIYPTWFKRKFKYSAINKVFSNVNPSCSLKNILWEALLLILQIYSCTVRDYLFPLFIVFFIWFTSIYRCWTC